MSRPVPVFAKSQWRRASAAAQKGRSVHLWSTSGPPPVHLQHPHKPTHFLPTLLVHDARHGATVDTRRDPRAGDAAAAPPCVSASGCAPDGDMSRLSCKASLWLGRSLASGLYGLCRNQTPLPRSAWACNHGREMQVVYEQLGTLFSPICTTTLTPARQILRAGDATIPLAQP
ncbi:hypothetical protein BS50DRAFT_590565 [Corynespora cassiicola Philippines]|uniref:Uncharacterized protein n=1 Tax=Corynespora cassiicola Philippines TaxID=1448308 RepID=A0A2T2NHD8_CORCC|nr:hypothetical protein BS50DRAFT_590565 [Corynespora cassiicola Philippines]